VLAPHSIACDNPVQNAWTMSDYQSCPCW